MHYSVAARCRTDSGSFVAVARSVAGQEARLELRTPARYNDRMVDLPTGPRIGLLGPRRVRQGLGPYYATWFERAGATVQCFAVSRPESLDAARDELERRCAHAVAGYVGLDAMLRDERIDALVIASPTESHEAALEAALAANVHVLCEKPILPPDAGSGERAARIVQEFAARGLHLSINTQWPYTLPAYRQLFPAADPSRFSRFWMLLSPGSVGPTAIADSMPHPLSILQLMTGDADAELLEPSIEVLDDVGHHHAVRFDVSTRGRRIACQVDLEHNDQPPRRAGYGIDGHRAWRRIELPEYRQFLDADGRSVPVEDPLWLHVADFVARLMNRRAPEIQVFAASRARMLETLMSIYPGSREG